MAETFLLDVMICLPCIYGTMGVDVLAIQGTKALTQNILLSTPERSAKLQIAFGRGIHCIV